jgi:hypothetical protein
MVPDGALTAQAALAADATNGAQYLTCQAQVKTLRAWFLAQIKAGTLVP